MCHRIQSVLSSCQGSLANVLISAIKGSESSVKAGFLDVTGPFRNVGGLVSWFFFVADKSLLWRWPGTFNKARMSNIYPFGHDGAEPHKSGKRSWAAMKIIAHWAESDGVTQVVTALLTLDSVSTSGKAVAIVNLSLKCVSSELNRG